jgi:hypothetical protein
MLPHVSWVLRIVGVAGVWLTLGSVDFGFPTWLGWTGVGLCAVCLVAWPATKLASRHRAR